ncbi:hypothetical protein EVAR_37853_1 [Eumeta japonica]|uniref:Reverse transcriptase domain-containing protein n=1 Tax=Eumeta variegata TaxID=151549 RepID=A0A4C1X495_EUMVA|nr:hypothetical protein EVAR_37853_1 [Eumeta japonica]
MRNDCEDLVPEVMSNAIYHLVRVMKTEFTVTTPKIKRQSAQYVLPFQEMPIKYVDDLCIINTATNPGYAVKRVGWAAEEIIKYYNDRGLKCNVEKAEFALFMTKQKHERKRKTQRATLKIKDKIRYLGIQYDKRLNMNKHVQKVLTKCTHDLHKDMLEKYRKTEIPGISVDEKGHPHIQDVQYIRHGPTFAQSAGTIKYLNR